MDNNNQMNSSQQQTLNNNYYYYPLYPQLQSNPQVQVNNLHTGQIFHQVSQPAPAYLASFFPESVHHTTIQGDLCPHPPLNSHVGQGIAQSSTKSSVTEPCVTSPLLDSSSASSSSLHLTITAVVLYIFGLIFWLPQIVSMCISLYQVHRGYFTRHKIAITILATLEIIAWIGFPALISIYMKSCFSAYDSSSSDFSSSLFSSSSAMECGASWWGFVVSIWYPVSVSLGIPRLILSYRESYINTTHTNNNS
eukprot:TRINITY_DN3963_c0_g1_i1.p1 TRINITY_DN3963_c0_g1~~TRINITY_DN3963_c0_g1_i1.p1  ORF type:complete len:261 (+),score=17.55 TRINITY_DN3963_c0_g1_i1:33-785(+)